MNLKEFIKKNKVIPDLDFPERYSDNKFEEVVGIIQYDGNSRKDYDILLGNNNILLIINTPFYSRWSQYSNLNNFLYGLKRWKIKKKWLSKKGKLIIKKLEVVKRLAGTESCIL